VGDGQPPDSVAPPSWAPPRAVAPSTPVGAAVARSQEPAEAALRWRLRAATIDYWIVYAGYLLLCGLLHWRVVDVGHLIVVPFAVAAYHFALESQGGQTIGKRRYGLRVVGLDGSPVTPKAVAIRSVLRVIDQVPVFYASGLISMLRTGPARRQRIGDVVAETKVIAVDGVAARRGTPGWMLPTATLVAFLFSVLLVVGIVKRNGPLTSTQRAQFVAGCQYSAPAGTDCECFLSRLEADGYTTLDSIKTLTTQAASQQSTGQYGPARQALENALLTCR
jgi:uncharacterized RDD family membrane protein YckC